MVVYKRRQNLDVDHCALQNSLKIPPISIDHAEHEYLHIISDSADILIVKTSFWNEKRSTHSKGFYIKKIKAEVVLFMKTALFVSKSDSHERRSIKEDQPIFFKSRRQWLVHIFFEIRCSYITQVKIFWWLIPYLRDFHLRIKPTRHLDRWIN